MALLRAFPVVVVVTLGIAIPTTAVGEDQVPRFETTTPVVAGFSPINHATVYTRETSWSSLSMCFSKPVRVEVQVTGRDPIGYTGGPDCLNAGYAQNPDGSYVAQPLYDDCPYRCSYKGRAVLPGLVEVRNCGFETPQICVVPKPSTRKRKQFSADWRIYYGETLIGAMRLRFTTRWLPAIKAKYRRIFAGTDAYWNVCVMRGKDVWRENGRYYCVVRVQRPRKAGWTYTVRRLSGPDPGQLYVPVV